MAYISDFIGFFSATFALFAQSSPLGLILSVLAGLILAALCLLVAVNYTRLWNTRYKPGFIHYVLCGIAAVITFLATVIYFALDHTSTAAVRQVKRWETALQADEGFSNRQVAAAYWAVRSSRLEEQIMAQYPAPGTPGFHGYPQNSDGAKRIAAKVYADAAVRSYKEQNPFLAIFVSPREAPVDVWYNDETAFFRSEEQKHPGQGATYYDSNGIAAIATAIDKDIVAEAQRLIPETRIILVCLFIFVQLIPFSLIGWAAYRDIKVIVNALPRA